MPAPYHPPAAPMPSLAPVMTIVCSESGFRRSFMATSINLRIRICGANAPLLRMFRNPGPRMPARAGGT